jgi:asparagine synthase (glutamine-hydrolysing)
MCGITGALDLTGTREFPLRRLLAMTGAIAHRGPDDEHVHVEPGVVLGVRRLAIMDLVNGRQPMSNEPGNIWASFNGELFNYPELRQKVLSHGHHISTHCDSEIWVHLFEDYGEGMFERAQGQFAVSLWDRRHRTLLLGRDRMGICPLYYAVRDGWLLWGSEVKALLASGLVAAEPDRKGVDYFFNFYSAGLSRTFFEGVKLLPPGHFLRVKDGRIEVRQYWDLEFPDAGEERHLANPKPLIEELDSLLHQAVERRMRSDVPVVSYLSGGIDSTMILDLTRRQPGGVVPSFTIGMDDGAGPDERSQSAKTAALLGSRMTTVRMDSSKIAHSFPALITAAEGPVLDTSCAAMLRLAAEVKDQGYKVVLTGEGADEALAGYIWFKTQKMGGWVGPRVPQLLRKVMRLSIGMGQTKGLVTPGMTISGVRPAQQYMYEAVSIARGGLYSDDMWESLKDHDPYSDLEISNDSMKRWDPLNQSLYVGYKMMLAGLLMISKGDRVSMQSSVEARYPYLDEDVVNFCASISPKYKLRGMTEKWILRQVAAKSLPLKIANRPKTMFRSVLSKTFLGPDRPTWVDQLLSPESLHKTGYFDPKAVARERAMLNFPRMMPRQFVFDAALTSVVSTQLWHHLFCGGGLCDLPVWDLTPNNFDKIIE